uniref:Uncharacterized protein n=1 Tax=Eutreptiella gymnastica TaxID=73025 RepID=A0A7S1ILA9_9EUGL
MAGVLLDAKVSMRPKSSAVYPSPQSSRKTQEQPLTEESPQGAYNVGTEEQDSPLREQALLSIPSPLCVTSPPPAPPPDRPVILGSSEEYPSRGGTPRDERLASLTDNNSSRPAFSLSLHSEEQS